MRGVEQPAGFSEVAVGERAHHRVDARVLGDDVAGARGERLGISTLREAGEIDGLPKPLRSRARHVITENARVDAMVEALRAGDLRAAARLLDEGHASLRDDYAASVPEVEATVERLKAAGAAGARMVGGGFGGSVLALLPPGVAVPEGALAVVAGPAARLL